MSTGRRPTPGSAGKDPDFNFADASRSTGPGTPGSSSSLLSSRRSSLDAQQSRDLKLRDVLLQPQEILALYASPTQVAKGETVNLASLNCQNQSVFVVVDTTAPLPRKLRTASLGGSARKSDTLPPFKPPPTQGKSEVALNSKQDGKSQEEMETMGAVPAWLKAELNDTEIVWSGSKPDKKDVNRRPMTTPAQLPSHVNVRETAQEEDDEQWQEPPPRRQARQPFSKADPDGRLQSPFTPSSPYNDPGEPGRWTKASGRRGSDAAHRGSVKMKADANAEQLRLRKLNRELILKENKLKNQSNDMAKEKEAALNDEIERLRSELLKHQDVQNKALRTQMTDHDPKSPPVTDSSTCAVM